MTSRAFSTRISLGEAERITGVASVATFAAPPNAIGRAGPTLFVTGLGLSELTQGTASVMTLANLAMLTGSIGRAGAGMLPLRGQNNVQGNADMGSMPDPADRLSAARRSRRARQLARRSGARSRRSNPGLTIPEMLAGATRKGRSARCGSRARTSRRAIPTRRASSKPSKRSTCSSSRSCSSRRPRERAHLVLPAAGVLEQEGTFTNGERRIQHVRPAVAPPGEARARLADRARRGAARSGWPWSYAGPGRRHGRDRPRRARALRRRRYDRLEADGLQWPCPEPRTIRARRPFTRTAFCAAGRS